MRFIREMMHRRRPEGEIDHGYGAPDPDDEAPVRDFLDLVPPQGRPGRAAVAGSAGHCSEAEIEPELPDLADPSEDDLEARGEAADSLADPAEIIAKAEARMAEDSRPPAQAVPQDAEGPEAPPTVRAATGDAPQTFRSFVAPQVPAGTDGPGSPVFESRLAPSGRQAPQTVRHEPEMRDPAELPPVRRVRELPTRPEAGAPQRENPTTRPTKIWDLEDEADERDGLAPLPPMRPQAPQVPRDEPRAAPVQEARPSGRVRTRLLGFQAAEEVAPDVFQKSEGAAAAASVRYPVGWVVVEKGPGKGASFALLSGVSQIGRGEDQAIQLDFGDLSVSRNNHAAIAYDDEERKFYLGHGGKSNLVRLNGKPVLSTEDLASGDRIRIGETVLLFVALCGADFAWDEGGDAGGV